MRTRRQEHQFQIGTPTRQENTIPACAWTSLTRTFGPYLCRALLLITERLITMTQVGKQEWRCHSRIPVHFGGSLRLDRPARFRQCTSDAAHSA